MSSSFAANGGNTGKLHFYQFSGFKHFVNVGLATAEPDSRTFYLFGPTQSGCFPSPLDDTNRLQYPQRFTDGASAYMKHLHKLSFRC
jgi:hypothetical protein